MSEGRACFTKGVRRQTDGSGPLRNAMGTRADEAGLLLADLTVLSKELDPYRLGQPEQHRDAKWVVEQIERAYRPDQRVYGRGLHYAFVTQGTVRKPDRSIYRNTDKDWAWLCHAVRTARWLGYLSFERISDNRNDEPLIYRTCSPVIGPPTTGVSGLVSSKTTMTFESEGGLDFWAPSPDLSNFRREQPNALVIFGEKSSLKDVLSPVAQRAGADLYIGAGEIRTLIYQMAKDAIMAGRPLIVVTCCDFDPAGRQMPVSIGRKLQALRDLFFPDLQFEVAPAALTVEQVREHRLPSTPLKAKERRRDRWRAEFGVEQTEIDALLPTLLTPQFEGVLAEIVEQSLAPYYDRDLADRVEAARLQWLAEARNAISDKLDNEAVYAILAEAQAADAEIAEEVEALRDAIEDILARAEEKADELNGRLDEVVADAEIELPEPVVPEVELAEKAPGSVLVSSAWTWVEQTRSLKARKSYGNGDDGGDE